MTNEKNNTLTNEELNNVVAGAAAPSDLSGGGPGGPGPIDGTGYQLPGNPGGMPSRDFGELEAGGKATV